MALALTGSPQITAAALDAAVNAELAANWFPLAGVTTNSNAAAGQVGEYISSTVLVGAGVAPASNTPANVTSIALTAGDWEVCGNVCLNAAVSTQLTQFMGWVSTGSAAFPTAPNGGAVALWTGNITGQPVQLPTGTMRVSLAGPTTVYLSTNAVWTVQQPGIFGFIGARRVR